MLGPDGGRRGSRTWEDKWSDPSFDPWWRTDEVPEEFLSTLRDYAPNSGSRLLDLGCGDGHLTCLLSMTYPNTIGVDIAPAAITLARANAGRLGAPAKFKVRDICKDELPEGTYDLLIDRGCLHVMNAPDAVRTAANIGRWLRPGGYFLQMHLLGANEHAITDQFLRALGPQFNLERTETTELNLRGNSRDVGYFVYLKNDWPANRTMT